MNDSFNTRSGISKGYSPLVRMNWDKPKLTGLSTGNSGAPATRFMTDEAFIPRSRDIYFFDDLELLPRYWQSANRDSVGELLIGFFHYYHKEFRYTFDVVSIRVEGGILNKSVKGWASDVGISCLNGRS